MLNFAMSRLLKAARTEDDVLAGHNRTTQPAMYRQAWTPMCNLMLIRDLMAMASSGVHDLSFHEQHLMRSLQDSELSLTVQQALDHAWFADCFAKTHCHSIKSRFRSRFSGLNALALTAPRQTSN